MNVIGSILNSIQDFTGSQCRARRRGEMRQNLGASSGPTVRHRYFTYFCFKTFRAQLFLLKNDTFSLLMFLAGNEMNEIKENFEAKGCPGFPGIIGVINGTQIRIRAPTRHPEEISVS